MDRQSGLPAHLRRLQQPPYPSAPYQTSNNEQKPSAPFAPASSSLNQRHSFSNAPRPDPRTLNQSSRNRQPQQIAHYQQRAYIPQVYPFQQPSYPAPHIRPLASQTKSNLSIGNGYSSDPEPHRRKHKYRQHCISNNSRSINADGFLGAAGGGLIGDLIFPGLGLFGGALVGWVGGRDYGKHRKWREEKRDREQEKWERKFGSRFWSHRRNRRKGAHERWRRRD